MQSVFHAPGVLISGAGSRAELAPQLQQLRAPRVLVVTDSYLVRSGVLDEFLTQLDAAGIRAAVFDGVQPDPTDANVHAGVEALRAAAAEAVVAIGGGSPIDAAKMIAIAAANPEPLSEFQGYHRIPRPGLPLIAIPTTAGTGSEATKVAVITDIARNVKMMILDAKLMPSVAIVDFELSLSMPRPLTAHVGVDTLTHGLEAFVSRKANAFTDPLALSCIGLTARHLRTAWNHPSDREARQAMSIAACHGGMAFTNSGLCLVHGMSRPMGAVFHLAHGLANAVLLPAVTAFSLSGALDRYARAARLMRLCDSPSDDEAARTLVAGLEQLNRDLEVPRLRDCAGVSQSEFEQHLPKMAHDAIASGSPGNNPVIPEPAEIEELYRRAW